MWLAIVADSCEGGNELPGPVKLGTCFDELRKCQLPQKDSAPCNGHTALYGEQTLGFSVIGYAKWPLQRSCGSRRWGVIISEIWTNFEQRYMIYFESQSKPISPFAEKGHPREIDRANEVDKLSSL
jgi:hypothetical protein